MLCRIYKNFMICFMCYIKHAQERGAIDFDMPETKIVFGKDRKIEKIFLMNALIRIV